MRTAFNYKTMTAKLGTILCALALLLPGCGPKSDSGLLGALFLSDGDDKSGSALISAAAGGVVRLNDEVTLTVPAYSIADDTKITIERVRDIPGGNADGLFAFGQAYRFLPRGTEFDMAAPAVLEMSYDEAELARLGFDPGTMQICYFDEELACYVPVNCFVDTARNTITAYVEHFTVYLPMAKALLPTNNDPYVGVQTPLPNPIRAGAPVYIRATVTDFDGSIAGVTLRYRKLHGAGAGVWNTVRMTKQVNPQATLHTYGYLVPADFLTAADIGDGNDIEYRVEAVDNLGSIQSSTTRRYDVTLTYQPGSLVVSPAVVDIAAGFQRMMTMRGSDSGGSTFTLVPETFTMASGSCALENRYAQGVLLSAVTQTPSGSPDEFTVGFDGESASAAVNVHAGELESIEILNNNGLPLGHTIIMYEGLVYSFDVVGRDGYGNTSPVLPEWSCDPSIGTIDSNGVLDTTGTHGSGVVTASLMYLSDTQNVYVRSREKDITAFSINGVDGVISYPFITVTLPWGTDVTNLVATFSTTGTSVTVDGDVQQSGVTANDFTDPVVYRVTAEEGSTQDYTVRVRMLSPYKDITAFSINGVDGVINDTNITMTLPYGTDVTALVAEFTTTGQSVAVGGATQESGVTANNFTGPVTYTVTAEDGTTKDYTIVVSVVPNIIGLVTHFAGNTGGAGSADGIGQDARLYDSRGITSDGENVYFTDWGHNTVRKMSIATGEVTTIAGTAGTGGSIDGIGSAARFYGPWGITNDGTNLYVADFSNNIIRAISIATGEVTTIAGRAYNPGYADGIGTAARFQYPAGITTDGANLYVTEWGNQTIRKIVIATGEVTTLAGEAGTTGWEDGIGTEAHFHTPTGITTDGVRLYVADTGNFVIRQIDIATAQVSSLAGYSGISGTADGYGAEARFISPRDIIFDGDNLYVADTFSQRIRKIVLLTKEVTSFAGQVNVAGSNDGIGTAAHFYNPFGITTDGVNLYISDTNNYTLRKINLSTAEVTTIAGAPALNGYADGIGSAAQFRYPQGVVADTENVYVSDTSNLIIRKIIKSTGEVTTLAGSPNSPGSNDGTGAAARFRLPQGLAVSGADLFVADTPSHTIRKIIIATGEVTTLAGTAGSLGTADGIGSDARFNNPVGLASDGTSVYVTDTGNHTIRKIVIATGEVSTLAGQAGTYGTTDGIGTAAAFHSPVGIVIQNSNLWVADTGNHTVRRINVATGAVTTFAGSAGAIGSIDAIGTAARFNYPRGIATDGVDLYVSDMNNMTIRKISIAAAEVSSIAGAPRVIGSEDGLGSAARFYNPYALTYDGSDLYVADFRNHCIRKIE